MRLHFENNIFEVSRFPRARPFVILRGSSAKNRFGVAHTNLSKVAECSEVALFEKTCVIFKIKWMIYLLRFRLSLEGTEAYFDCVNCSCRNRMSNELIFT